MRQSNLCKICKEKMRNILHAQIKSKKNSDRLFSLFAALTWGFTMWSRTAFNYYTSELGLSASDAGMVNFVTSIGCTISAIVLSKLADKKGWHKQVLAVGLITAGIMQLLLSGSTSFIMMILWRFLMGLGIGCVYSLTQAIIKEASTPERYSTNAGIVENGEAVISTMMGPVIIVFFITKIGWRRSNILLIIPVLLIAIVWLIIWRKSGENKDNYPNKKESKIYFKDLLGIHNMRLCIFLGVLTLTGIWTMYIYCPMYWTQSAGFSDIKMSQIMTGMGLAAMLWCLILPALSNKIGRKKVTGIFSAISALTFLLLFLVPGTIISMISFIVFAGCPFSLSLFFMAIIATESVGPKNAASAISIVNASSEILGGAVCPLLAGYLSDRFGVKMAMLFAAICMVLVLLITTQLNETAPNLKHKEVVQ